MADKGQSAQAIGNIVMSFLNSMKIMQDRNSAIKKETEQAEDNRRQAQLEITKLAAENPELANLVQLAMSDMMNPAKLEEIKHQNEGLIPSLRHKGIHKDIARRKGEFKLEPFGVSPQLKAQRDEAVAKAERERTLADEVARKAELKKGLLDKDPNGVLAQMINLDLPMTAESIAGFQDPKGTLARARANQPFTPEWIAEQSSGLMNDLFKEFPDAPAEAVRAKSQSMFDPDFKMPLGMKLPKSLSGRGRDLEAASLEESRKRRGLDEQRFNLEFMAKKGELAKYIADNAGATSESAVDLAGTFLKTGKLGIPMPADRQKELGIKHQEAQTSMINLQLEQAKFKSIKFDQLLEQARVETDGDKKSMLLDQAYVEFKKVHGIEAPERDAWKEIVMPLMMANPASGPMLSRLAATPEGRAFGAKAGAMALGAADSGLRAAAKGVVKATEGIGKDLGAVSSLRGNIGAALQPTVIRDTFGPEVEAQVKSFSDGLMAAVKDPGTSVEARREAGRIAKELMTALAAKDHASVMQILSGMTSGAAPPPSSGGTAPSGGTQPLYKWPDGTTRAYPPPGG